MECTSTSDARRDDNSRNVSWYQCDVDSFGQSIAARDHHIRRLCSASRTAETMMLSEARERNIRAVQGPDPGVR